MKDKQTLTWATETRLISHLAPATYNPRKMTPKEKEDITASLDGFGRVVPLVINTGSRAHTIIGGHQRYQIYKEQGVTEIEVMVPSRELSLQEEQELNLRLNKNTGSWDMDLLKDMDFDLLLDVGFEDEDLEGFFDDMSVADDDFDVEKAVKEVATPRVEPGQIWQLGKHRLLVGSSLDDHLVTKLFEGKTAHLVYQDPPYNIGLDYNSGIGGSQSYGGSFSKKKDSQSRESYQSFLNESIRVALKHTHTDTHIFYWCDSNYIGMIQSLYTQHSVTPRRVCLWLKNNQNPTPKIAFNKAHEPCVYGTIGVPPLNPKLKNVHEVMNQNLSTGNQLHDEVFDMFDVWLARRDSASTLEHPTQKPVTLAERPLRRCSAPNHIVFCGFGGSGSELIACEQLGRIWYGVEQDLVFATIILNRWEAFTGNKAKCVWT